MTFSVFLIPTIAVLAQLMPPIAVVPAWRRTSPARKWITIWCLVFFLSDLVQLGLAVTRGNNLWIFTYLQPIEDTLLLWALSHWQTRPVTRIALRIAIPLVVATYVAIAIVAGELDTFRTFSGPFRALLMMLCTAYTLISNVAASPERAWNHDWLWTTIGVLLYFGLLVIIDPIAAAMGPDQLVAMRRLYNARSFGDVLAFVLIWRGMRCPLPSSSSGST